MDRFSIEGGEVRVEQTGLMTVIEAETEKQGSGIVRLAAMCGSTVRPVGVLAPERGRLTLRKRLTRADREAMGIVGITGFTLLSDAGTERQSVETEAKKEPPPVREGGGWFSSRDELGWKETAAPERLFADRTLYRAVRGARGALTAESGPETLIAIPMDSERPFPPLPVFKYGEPAVIRGRGYVVFRLEDGELIG